MTILVIPGNDRIVAIWLKAEMAELDCLTAAQRTHLREAIRKAIDYAKTSKKKRREIRERFNDRQRCRDRRAAKAVAEGRVPGQMGRPITSTHPRAAYWRSRKPRKDVYPVLRCEDREGYIDQAPCPTQAPSQPAGTTHPASQTA